MTEEDLLLSQHSFDIDNFLKDCDVANEFPINVSGHSGLLGPTNIWSSTSSSTACNGFSSFPGLSGRYPAECNNTQWSTYTQSLQGKGSPLKDGSFTPLSQPGSETESDNSWRFDSVSSLDFGKPSADCGHYYPDAASQWGRKGEDSNGIYDPFRGSSVIDDLGSMHMMGAGDREKSPLKRSQSANVRPTFADVMKKPSSPGSEPPPTPSLSSEDPVYGSQDSLNSLQEKKIKPKVFRPAQRRHGGYHVPLPINPDSKYGLDDFEVHEVGAQRSERSFSCGDSIGCSPSPTTTVGSAGEEARAKLCVNGKILTGKSGSASNSRGKANWFDPKRIFQNGGSRSRSESVPCDTILNNNISARFAMNSYLWYEILEL